MAEYHKKCVSVSDPELNRLIEEEMDRQSRTINLIASENLAPVSVLQCNSSVFTNRYSEGAVGNRYYAGTRNVDKVEELCKRRATELYNLSPDEWGVNVQVLSGTPANFAVYTAVAGKDGKILGLALSSGGHLSHGFRTPTRWVSATSLFFNAQHYRVNPKTGLLDYDDIERRAEDFRPNILICGASAYPRDWDYERLRMIADGVGSYLMCDMAHTAGLIAAGVLRSPFEHCDIVTTTTHKSLNGPRSAMIFYRKKPHRGSALDYDSSLGDGIDRAVFPGLHGGPHNHTITALCTCLNNCMTEEFKVYGKKVVENARSIADILSRNYNVVTGGTDNHMVLLDLGIDCRKLQDFFEECGIIVNSNAIPRIERWNNEGIRIGTLGITSRGMECGVVEEIAHTIREVIERFKSGNGRSDDIRSRMEEISAKYPIPLFKYVRHSGRSTE